MVQLTLFSKFCFSFYWYKFRINKGRTIWSKKKNWLSHNIYTWCPNSLIEWNNSWIIYIHNFGELEEIIIEGPRAGRVDIKTRILKFISTYWSGMLLAPLDLRKEEVGLLFRLPELAQLKKKVHSFEYNQVALGQLPYQTSIHFIPWALHVTSYRTPSCINSAVWIRVPESCGKNLTYMDCTSCFKGSKIYYVYYGAKNKCCCVWAIIWVKGKNETTLIQYPW